MAAPAEVPPGAKRALSHTAAPLHISYHFVFLAVWFVFLCYPFPAVAYIYHEYCHVVEWTGESVSDQDISSDDGHILTTVLHMTHTYFTEPAVGGASKMVRRGLEPTTQPIGTKPVRW